MQARKRISAAGEATAGGTLIVSTLQNLAPRFSSVGLVLMTATASLPAPEHPNTTDYGSVAGGTNALASALDHLLDLKKGVAVDYADVASCGYLTNTKMESVPAKAKDGQNQYLLSPDGTELGRSQIAGRRFEISNDLPANLIKGSGTNLSAVIDGNVADLLLSLDGTLEISVER